MDLVVSIGIHWYQTQHHRSAQSALRNEIRSVGESEKGMDWARILFGWSRMRWQGGDGGWRPYDRNPLQPGRWWFLWIVGESSPKLWPYFISGEWNTLIYPDLFGTWILENSALSMGTAGSRLWEQSKSWSPGRHGQQDLRTSLFMAYGWSYCPYAPCMEYFRYSPT